MLEYAYPQWCGRLRMHSNVYIRCMCHIAFCHKCMDLGSGLHGTTRHASRVCTVYTQALVKERLQKRCWVCLLPGCNRLLDSDRRRARAVSETQGFATHECAHHHVVHAIMRLVFALPAGREQLHLLFGWEPRNEEVGSGSERAFSQLLDWALRMPNGENIHRYLLVTHWWLCKGGRESVLG